MARHASERVSSAKIGLAVISLLALMGLDFGLSNLVSTLLLELPNGRKKELEGHITLTLFFVLES